MTQINTKRIRIVYAFAVIVLHCFGDFSQNVSAFAFTFVKTTTTITGRTRKGLITSGSALNVHIERKLEELGIELPSPPPPRANYNIVCYAPGLNHEKEMMYVSGHLPILNDGTLLTGPVGIGPDDKKESSPENGKTIEEGQLAARHAVLNLVSTMKDQLGDLDRVVQVVKVFGIVNSKTDFKHQHLVMDGCSDTFMEIFGKPVGYHARSAIGVNTLPLDITVEVEAIVQIKPE